ncbi:MAG: hypothetical protein IJI45_01580 [Anaerolineaceae bacterium]|nr:hypothetical protein [Oscillospiraceae bacterium]MBQ6479785.1 hypothetical protein [Anaerolineaceae bacterium]
MTYYHIYHPEIPPFLAKFVQAPEVKRLQNIGMNCGCEYTAFPLFRGLQPYSRYDHSIGVALIVWHFTQIPSQAISGLLHDSASPVFAHVVDFMNGDYLQQESTEAGTEQIIASSPELQELLQKNGLTTYDVCDHHRYPIADNDSPMLSADRLEYTLGNLINYGICTIDTVKKFYDDLTVGTNEGNQPEIMFRTMETAEAFAMAALRCSQIYVSDEDRYAMQILSEILRYAAECGIIHSGDLYTTEPEVIAKLQHDDKTAPLWEKYRSLARTVQAESPEITGEWRKIFAKKRCIDPMVAGKGRISMLSPAFQDALTQFLHASQDYWVCGI